ncbi:MAG: helix-turn-helix domain-containing protein [Acidothermaceae bacterium]
MSETSRLRALTEAGLMHPNAGAVRATLFTAGEDFFLAADKVQVKYEMLRAHLVDGESVTQTASAHGYSRAAFYLVLGSFGASGMSGLLDEPRGRRGPVKLSPQIVEFLHDVSAASGAELAEQVAARFGVRLHRRTIERARRR